MADLTNTTTIAANGQYNKSIDTPGDYRVQVGTKGFSDFGSGNVTVSQDGHTFSGFSAITSGDARRLLLDSGVLTVDVAGSSSPSLRVKVTRIMV